MLDRVIVVGTNGVVRWDRAFVPCPAAGSPSDIVTSLFNRVLLEERAAQYGGGGGEVGTYPEGKDTVRWATHREHNLIVAAVHQSSLVLPYVADLLSAAAAEIAAALRQVPPESRDGVFPFPAFTPIFEGLLATAEETAAAEKRAQRKQRTFAESKKYDSTRKAQRDEALGLPKQNEPKQNEPAKAPRGVVTLGAAAAEVGEGGGAMAEGAAEEEGEQEGGEEEAGVGLTAEQIAANRAKLRSKATRKKDGGTEGAKKDGGKDGGKKDGGKEGRSWDGGKAPAKLDFSADSAGPPRGTVARYRGEGVDLDAEFGASGKAEGGSSFFGGALSKLVGGSPLTADDLAPVLERLQARLIEKNVAEEVSSRIAAAVGASLVGHAMPTFGSVSSTVKSAMAEALQRVLSPSRRIDVLHEIENAKQNKRPYVIVFVGVNGVGKSTSLSKVAYYIKSNHLTPMLCACDTFRAGAVEQLRVHAQALDVPLFQKGYGNDAAQIASEGIAHAQSMGYDAVLVDTAGRMQDNEPLMRALAKLVHVNSPDLVLFVGEALAGNDAVDQVRGFNSALMQHSVGQRAPRLIDGLVLTKFDTIDDKVGAALSLVFTTGKPIVFVGVGQTYADIRNMNVDHVVKALTG